MTALFEMRIRVGGDPRGFDEFAQLRTELAKLSHPACPDVDWDRVEQWCLGLFESNGADLQTVACFTLARSHLHGLEGMAQGVALIEALGCEWAHLWPPKASARLDILAWLFAQMQPLLRGLEIKPQRLPVLVQLDTRLERLSERLEPYSPLPVGTLLALRQQVAGLVHRLKRSVSSGETELYLMGVPEPAWMTPVVVLPPPAPKALVSRPRTRWRRIAMWLFATTAAVALVSGLLWQDRLPGRQVASVFPDPISLDSMSLFDAGSTELKSGSTKVLINALVDIKAQPGWLIVIAGHTDPTGNAEHNLQLSRARATAVRDWMQRMGDIPDSCFAVQGFGATQPIVSNDTETGRAANRRVDIRLVPQTGACG